MKLPRIHGLIDRRILLNYRVDSQVLENLLPSPFRPLTVRGWGIAGFCLIRLKELRPKGLPGWLGISSENAALRIAVEWEAAHGLQHGVYILQRWSNSRINRLLGGRLFPGVHHRAEFHSREAQGHYDIDIREPDNSQVLALQAQAADNLPPESVFESLEECSRFFELGAIGYSPALRAGIVQGLKLNCAQWRVQPLRVDSVHAPLLNDSELFPSGCAQLDCALLMTDVPHLWEPLRDLRTLADCCPQRLVTAAS